MATLVPRRLRFDTPAGARASGWSFGEPCRSDQDVGMQLHVRMSPRDPTEEHRVATSLEPFLDLIFVVAIAQAAVGLHHGLVDGHVGDAFFGFPAVFFAIWWAWMNFTWFGSAYDSDDALYRVAVFVKMTGVLVLAAGIPRAFHDRDLALTTVGYVVMRLALVGQWLRVAVPDPSRSRTALRYAARHSVVQVGWLLRLLLPEPCFAPAFLVLVVAELLVPVWAEAAARTPWHPPHRRALRPVHDHRARRVGAGGDVRRPGRARRRQHLRRPRHRRCGGLLMVFSMWWIYFDLPSEVWWGGPGGTSRQVTPFLRLGLRALRGVRLRCSGRGGARGAVRPGHRSLRPSPTSRPGAATLPVTLYLLTVWVIHYRYKPPGPLRTVRRLSPSPSSSRRAPAPSRCSSPGSCSPAGRPERRRQPRTNPLPPTPTTPEAPLHLTRLRGLR